MPSLLYHKKEVIQAGRRASITVSWELGSISQEYHQHLLRPLTSYFPLDPIFSRDHTTFQYCQAEDQATNVWTPGWLIKHMKPYSPCHLGWLHWPVDEQSFGNTFPFSFSVPTTFNAQDRSRLHDNIQERKRSIWNGSLFFFFLQRASCIKSRMSPNCCSPDSTSPVLGLQLCPTILVK